MRRISVLTSLLLVAVMAMSCGQKIQEPLTEAPFFVTFTEAKQAAVDGKPILLDFFTDW
ncbi:MAG: hypothetical protein JSU74_04450 [Candidatus Zixiibacteriota bacterium]|nr:MAG: hypothetical protein JSU74_04450 [candidate division Zixibacteria bacterium]